MTTLSYGIVANNRGDKVFRRNAKVVVLLVAGDGKKLFVEGLSVGGRRVRKWVKRSDLCNYRGKWMQEGGLYETREDADRVATNLEIH